jgi:hypothetical protein
LRGWMSVDKSTTALGRSWDKILLVDGRSISHNGPVSDMSDDIVV